MHCDYLICNIQSLAGNKIALIEYLNEYKNNFIDVAIWDKGHGAPVMAENVMTSAWEYMFFISSNFEDGSPSNKDLTLLAKSAPASVAPAFASLKIFILLNSVI